jgi:hypothetical protein
VEVDNSRSKRAPNPLPKQSQSGLELQGCLKHENLNLPGIQALIPIGKSIVSGEHIVVLGIMESQRRSSLTRDRS